MFSTRPAKPLLLNSARETGLSSEVTLARRARRATQGTTASAPLGYEAQLWQMADALRGKMDAAEYKHVVLGLIFLKYISDAFEEQHARARSRAGAGRRPGGPRRVPRR